MNVEPRGDLLPLSEWTVEVSADGSAVVCATTFNRLRQYYTVHSVDFTKRHTSSADRQLVIE